jgi:hypothetical protein
VIATERQHELTAREPDEERKASRQLTVGDEQPAVVGELRLDREHSLGARVARLHGELDAHDGVSLGLRDATDPEHADLEVVVERHVDDRHDVHDREERAADPGREPQRSSARRQGRLHAFERRHRIAREQARIVQHRHQREIRNRVQVLGNDQRAVVPESRADPLEFEVRRERDRHERRGKDEERVELTLGILELRPRSHRDDADRLQLDHEHAGVFDAAGHLAASQPAEQGDAAARIRDRETGEIDAPVPRVVDAL